LIISPQSRQCVLLFLHVETQRHLQTTSPRFSPIKHDAQPRVPLTAFFIDQ
jgi:hypothetical protein